MQTNRAIYFALCDEDDEGVSLISLVADPATGYNLTIEQDDVEGMIITAPVLTANELIYRRGVEEDYYIIFPPATISEIIKRANEGRTLYAYSTEHSHNTDAILPIASYQTNENLEINGIPEGSWVVSLFIQDNGLKTAIRQRKLNGLSIEGLFSFEQVDPKELIELIDNYDD